MLAHGVQVCQVQNQEQAIADAYKQNPKFSGIVDILQMSFSRKLLKSGCKTGPLIILVVELEQANYIIDVGLIYRYKLYNCKLYNRNYIVTQCFQCYLYRHKARKCRNTRQCRFYRAIGHATNECIGKNDVGLYKCVPCQGWHKLQSRDCLVYKKHIEATQAAYNQRLARY